MALGYWIIGIVVAIFLLSGLRVVKQYERGVKFTLGRYVGVRGPGLRYVFPIIQSMNVLDIRQRTIDLEEQSAITNDQVSVSIDGVVFYAVEEAEKVVLNVENLREQVRNKTTSELKDIIGEYNMSNMFEKRDDIAKKLKTRLSEAIEDKNTDGQKKDWGIAVKYVQINDINLSKELIRAMAKQAEADRERVARKTKAEGEREASEKFKQASKNYADNAAAMKLRELQTYQEIGIEQNSLMVVAPSDTLKGNGNWAIPLGANELQNNSNSVSNKSKRKRSSK
ncbi:MAG: SPFH domain-containing protein [Candidatus Pacearchaeota archaeon]